MKIECKYCKRKYEFDENLVLLNDNRKNNWIIDTEDDKFICKICYEDKLEYERLKYKFEDNRSTIDVI